MLKEDKCSDVLLHVKPLFFYMPSLFADFCEKNFLGHIWSCVCCEMEGDAEIFKAATETRQSPSLDRPRLDHQILPRCFISKL